MKKIILFFCTIFCTIGTTYAQWTNATNGADMYNINTGNVGVGTTTPASLFSVGSLSQFQVNSSGLTSLNNTTPEFRFINSADGGFARFLRGSGSSNNFFAGKNKVAQSGGTSNALNFTATPANQYLSMPDNGLSTSSGFIVSFWINSTSIASQGLFGFSNSITGTTGMGIFTDNTGKIYAIVQNGTNFGSGTYGIQGLTLNNNTNYHVVYYYQPGNVRLFVNNVEYTTAYGGGGFYMTQTAGETFFFGNSPFFGLSANNLVLDQALFYSSLSDADRAALYNNGNGTATIPTTGLIRQYDFEDDISNTTTEELGTGYNGALNNGLSLTNNGIIPLSSSPSEVTFFSSADGVTNGEKGIATWGDFNGRNQQQGKWFQWLQGTHYPLVSDNNGHWLFNPSNTSTTLPAVASTVDVAGNITIGSGYAGVNAAPANGLLVQGNVGIGTTSPPSDKLDVEGGNIVVYNTGLGTSVRVGSTATGKTSMTMSTSADASGYGILESIAASGSVYGNTLINPNGGNVAIGTTDPRGFKLAVNGSAIAESMTVLLHTAWPDYVFKPNYTLPSLTQVKSYIDKNQHLPEMPSEQEISEKGLNLGEMNKLLVKKVEELTLYLIEKDKEDKEKEAQFKEQQEINKSHQKELVSQQNEINELKQQLSTITKVLSKN